MTPNVRHRGILAVMAGAIGLLLLPPPAESQSFAVSLWDVPAAPPAHAVWDGVHLGMNVAASSRVGVQVGASAYGSHFSTSYASYGVGSGSYVGFGWTSGIHAWQSVRCYDAWYDPWGWYYPYCDWGWHAYRPPPIWWAPPVYAPVYRSGFALSIHFGRSWRSPVFYDPWYGSYHPGLAWGHRYRGPLHIHHHHYHTIYVHNPPRWVVRPPVRTAADAWRPVRGGVVGPFKEDPRGATSAPDRIAVPRGTGAAPAPASGVRTAAPARGEAAPATGRPAIERGTATAPASTGRAAAPPPDLRTRPQAGTRPTADRNAVTPERAPAPGRTTGDSPPSTGTPERGSPPAAPVPSRNAPPSAANGGATTERTPQPPTTTRMPERSAPPATDRGAPSRAPDPPAANRGNPGQGAPPAANQAPPRQQPPPAANRAPQTRSAPPATNRTPPAANRPPPPAAQNRTPPSANRTPPAANRAPQTRSAPPATNRTPPAAQNRTPPAANRTPPAAQNRAPPAASRTPPSRSTPPAAQRTPPNRSNPPAASRAGGSRGGG